MEQCVDFNEKMGDVVLRDVPGIILQQVIDANKQIGDWVKPREPGIFLKQFNQHVHGLNWTAQAFIGLLFGDDKGAVKPDEAFTDR
jgi:hypothetical protein